MTADEALRLSPTGFVWSEDGLPAYKRGAYWYWLDESGLSTEEEKNISWHPLPPSLRDKQEAQQTQESRFFERANYLALQLSAAQGKIAELEAENESLKEQAKEDELVILFTKTRLGLLKEWQKEALETISIARKYLLVKTPGLVMGRINACVRSAKETGDE